MNIMEIMKQAKDIEKRMKETEVRIGELEGEGTSGGGMVRVVMNGRKEMKKISIDPSLLVPGEVEVLEDLIVAAFNEAKLKMDESVAREMENVTAGLPIPPGMKLPF